jgi:hypothetical protein
MLDQGDLNNLYMGKKECALAQCGSFHYDMSIPESNGHDVRRANMRRIFFKFAKKITTSGSGILINTF